jgi:SAM-dependent methyltransferase
LLPHLARARRAVSDRLYAMGPARYYRPAYRHIADLIRPAAGLFLDVGCGPGWLAIDVAATSPRIRSLGIDRSPTMIGLAEHNARQSPNVAFRVMEGARMDLEAGSVDVAAAVQSAHHWEDAPALLAEVGRVLAPRARFYVYEADSEAASVPAGWVERAGPWPPDAWVRGAWRRYGMGERSWRSLIDTARESGFDIENGRHGFYRRMVLTRATVPLTSDGGA